MAVALQAAQLVISGAAAPHCNGAAEICLPVVTIKSQKLGLMIKVWTFATALIRPP